MSSSSEIKLIIKRIDKLFNAPKFNTIYRIVIVNDTYDHWFNFFFNERHKFKNERSTPVHSVKEYSLEYLEEIVQQLQKQWNFTIEFVNFENQYWPSNGKLIQKGRFNNASS